MSVDETNPTGCPESGLSPKTQTTQPTPEKHDYFSLTKKRRSNAAGHVQAKTSMSTPKATGANNPNIVLDLGARVRETDNTGDASASTPGETTSSSSSSAHDSRKGSLTNITFLTPTNPSLPRGQKKPHGGSRIRDASPPHRRFESHVAFDNIPLGDPTPYNPISFTLNVRHAGFQFRRRHRTFMVGVDDNSYSDHALQWLLDELVDDGDEIVCVRVIETQVRLTDKTYQEDAKALMESIQAKNVQNHAISLVLEYAVGKLHNTFQHLIKIYQPSMLIVGTKGRSLEGVHGFLVNRSSFSKYCLQYSPVPVVVVRPTEKREKKKAKRAEDPSRQSYVNILGGRKHEADSENYSVYELEPTLTADEEAHRVAVAVGLPAAYDPTLKPLDTTKLLRKASRLAAMDVQEKATRSAGKKTEDSDSDEEDEEFEVTSGADLLRKERLHNMELNEGAALRAEMSKSSLESGDSDEDPGGGGVKT